MTKVVLTLSGLLVVLALAAVAVLVAAPLLFNGQGVRDALADTVEAATGRAFRVNGAVNLSIALGPQLSLTDVTLANLPGADDPAMLHIDEIQLALSPGALLRGALEAKSVVLIHPTLHLERIHGAANWDFTPGGLTQGSLGAGNGGAANGPVPGDSDGPAPKRIFSLRLHSLSMVDGEIEISGGQPMHLTNASATLAQDAADDPWTWDAAAALNGTPLTGHGLIGAYAVSGKRTLDVTIANGLSAAQGHFSGALTSDDDGGLTAHGTLTLAANGDDLAATATATATHLDLSSLVMHVGGVRAEGSLSGDWPGSQAPAGAQAPSLTGSLGLSAIDLDHAAKAAKAGGGLPADLVDALTDPRTPFGLSVPPNLSAAVTLKAPAIKWHGGVISDTTATLRWTAGRIDVEHLTADGPGDLSIAASGSLTDLAKTPKGDFALSLSTNALRDTATWIGAPIPAGISPARLNRLTLDGRVVGTLGALRLESARGILDASPYTASAAETADGLKVEMNSQAAIDLETYLPPPAVPGLPPVPSAAAPNQTSGDTASQGGADTGGSDQTVAFKLTAAVMRWRGMVVGRPFAMAGTLAATPDAISIDNLEVSLGSGATTLSDGLLSVSRADGTLSIAGQLDGGGLDARVDTLGGTGTAKVHGLKLAPVAGAAVPADGLLAVVLGPMAAVGNLTGGAKPPGGDDLSDLDVTWAVNGDIVSFRPITVASALYQLSLTGSIDLASRVADLKGAVDLSQALESGMQASGLRLPPHLTLAVSGGLDGPKVTLGGVGAPANAPANDNSKILPGLLSSPPVPAVQAPPVQIPAPVAPTVSSATPQPAPVTPPPSNSSAAAKP